MVSHSGLITVMTRAARKAAPRLRRDFGRNSIAGVTFTNRDQPGNHNRVLAGDFRYVWGLYYAQFQYGRSWTSDAAG